MKFIIYSCILTVHITLFFEFHESVSFRLAIFYVFNKSDLKKEIMKKFQLVELTDLIRPYSSNSRLSFDSLVSNLILKNRMYDLYQFSVLPSYEKGFKWIRFDLIVFVGIPLIKIFFCLLHPFFKFVFSFPLFFFFPSFHANLKCF